MEQKSLKKLADYNIGLDIGTNSVGWAVTDFNNNILKHGNKNMWGARLFNEGNTANQTRTLGSQTEEMYERGYDISDIIEREKYERWLSRQSDMLEDLCRERSIKLWEEDTKNEENKKEVKKNELF